MKNLTYKETEFLKEVLEAYPNLVGETENLKQSIKQKVIGRTYTEIVDTCERHVDVQLDLHFQAIAEEFDVMSGDISPDDSLILSKIAEDLTKLSVKYVTNNKGY